METFILLTKLSNESLGSLQEREHVGRDWFDAVKSSCPEVQWIDHYALLGPFDFMDIYAAPSQEVAAKVAMITMSKGAVKAESWGAIPYKRFLDIVKSI